MNYQTVLYSTDGPTATITLNRPEELNTIVAPMPDEVEHAVHTAVRDHSIKVIVLRGAGRAFCAGYHFGDGFRYGAEFLNTNGAWDPGRDMMHMTSYATSPHQKFMSIWRSPKPVIAQVHGWCVGGGSDYALLADLVIASDDAQIGTPYSRMWGAYLSGMWIYRLGLTRAKHYALTGRPLSGREAADVGLINEAVPFADLETLVRSRAGELAALPAGQLAAQKMMVNQTYENMGLASTQTLGAVLDGMMRNIPEAKSFIELAAEQGVSSVIAERDGRFGDYSQAPPASKPDPRHVIRP
jgi:enoyl-CoA hydratase